MKSLKIINFLICTCMFFTTNLTAEPTLPAPVEDVVKMEKLAGEPGPFTVKDEFPKDYLLIPKNLPFLVGLSLYHPESENLELTKEQITSLLNVKKTVMPYLAQIAKKAKKLEIEIVEGIALKHDDTKAETFYSKVDEIAKLRAELTKAHLRCIEKVKAILTEEQYQELLDYGVVNMF